LLIGFYNESETSRKNALQAMLVTVFGGLAMMAGIILTGMMAGSYNFIELMTDSQALKDHPWYLAALILFTGSIYQICTISLSFLASQCHGCTGPGKCIPSFHHNGKGRNISAGAGSVRYTGELPNGRQYLPPSEG
jgi:hypothetical protein